MPVNYTNNEIIRMREQAIVRAKEMQSRAAIKDNENRQPLTSAKKNIPHEDDSFAGRGTLHFEKKPQTDEEFCHDTHILQSNNKKPQQKPSPQNNDRMLVMTLLLILIADGADKMLIFALMYIMM